MPDTSEEPLPRERIERPPWRYSGGSPMPDVPSALPKSARLRGDDEESPEEPERSAQDQAERERYQGLVDQERSAMAKLAALRERLGSEADGEAKLDADLSALAAEVRKHLPVLGTRGGLEERLWAALDRSVGVLERHLTLVAEQDEGEPGYIGVASSGVVRNIAETLDRLGLLEPPPPPVEAVEPDTSEVWVTASEAGFSTEQCDRLVVRLRERYEGRA